MNLFALAAAGYLLVAVVTYGRLIDHPAEFDLSRAADDIRAAHPRASEREIRDALKKGHHRMSLLVAAVWPLLAALIIMAIPVAVHRRIRTRK